MRTTLLFLLFLCTFCSAKAQIGAGAPEEMKAISGLVGKWSGVMKMAMPGQTEPMDVPTEVDVKMYGPYQETIYTMDMGTMGKFSGHMFLTYDSGAKCYKGWSFDDNVNEPRFDKGDWDGKKLVLTSEPQAGVVSRITFEPKSKDEVYFIVEIKNGEKFEKMGDVTYKRKG